ncbi:hypothetical protein Tco_1359289 [Tanacetum coccineum]
MATDPKDVKRNITRTLREELLADVTLANNLLLELNRYLDQRWNRDPEILRLEELGDHPLIKSGMNTMDKSAHTDMMNSQNLTFSKESSDDDVGFEVDSYDLEILVKVFITSDVVNDTWFKYFHASNSVIKFFGLLIDVLDANMYSCEASKVLVMALGWKQENENCIALCICK